MIRPLIITSIMKNLPILIIIFIVSLLTACSSTQKFAIKKKPLTSDHYLMLSLLNRAITQDQQMMLAFKQQREHYQSSYFVNSITIKGPKAVNTSTKRVKHSYSNLIAQDFNAVQISGPY
jgi:hypothetical protein